MSDKNEVSLCILWEHELRIAGQLLKEAINLPDNTPDDVAGKIYYDAFRACAIALYHVEDASILMLASNDKFKRKIKPARKLP